MCWYDYSAVDPAIAISAADLGAMKHTLNNDARRMDWRRKDVDFAAELEKKLLQRLDAAEADPSISRVAVVTHVPLVEVQMTRKPDDPRWGTSNAYFGNLTTGRAVLTRPKVKAIISGHSHVGQQGVVSREGLGDVWTQVVPSDYGTPKFVIVDV